MKRHSGLIYVHVVSVLVSRSSSLGSSPDRRHDDVFLGKTLYSHAVSLYPGI